MALPLAVFWLPLRFLAGAASAWVFVATSVWCLGALAERGAARASGWVYAGVGVGIALAGIHCLLASTAGVRSQPLWLQLGGLALVLALPGRSVAVAAEVATCCFTCSSVTRRAGFHQREPHSPLWKRRPQQHH